MKLKPILLGVSSKGILRVDPKTKEVLDMWDFQVLKNWAYSRKTFVLVSVGRNGRKGAGGGRGEGEGVEEFAAYVGLCFVLVRGGRRDESEGEEREKRMASGFGNAERILADNSIFISSLDCRLLPTRIILWRATKQSGSVSLLTSTLTPS